MKTIKTNYDVDASVKVTHDIEISVREGLNILYALRVRHEELKKRRRDFEEIREFGDVQSKIESTTRDMGVVWLMIKKLEAILL